MALLVCIFLVESACMTTLCCCHQWWYVAIVACLMVAQLYAVALHFDHTQNTKRLLFGVEKLNQGFSVEHAKAAACLQYPNLRSLGKMAFAMLRRKG